MDKSRMYSSRLPHIMFETLFTEQFLNGVIQSVLVNLRHVSCCVSYEIARDHEVIHETKHGMTSYKHTHTDINTFWSRRHFLTSRRKDTSSLLRVQKGYRSHQVSPKHVSTCHRHRRRWALVWRLNSTQSRLAHVLCEYASFGIPMVSMGIRRRSSSGRWAACDVILSRWKCHKVE